MKKWLLILTTAFILANPKLNILPVQFQLDVIQSIKDQISALQSPRQRKNIKIKQELKAITLHFSDDEKNYLNALSSNRESLMNFYRSYCLQKDFNPILYGDHLTKTCKVIAKNRDLIR